MPDKETLERFGDAVEEKKADAKAASEDSPPPPEAAGQQLPPEQQGRIDHAHEQDDRDPRAKNTAHKKETADKWNQ